MLKDVGMDHRRRHVAVTQELLHCADVVSSLEQVCGEGMPERVAGHPLFHPGFRRGSAYRPLHHRLVQMMPALTALAIAPARRRREYPLPLPVRRSLRKLRGSIVVRSRFHFGSRITSCPRPKSTSFTLSVSASSSRSPDPYSNRTTSLAAGATCSMTARTSSGVSTTGNLSGFCAADNG